MSGDAGDVVNDTVTAVAHDNEDNDVTAQGSESVNVTDVPPSGTVSKNAASASVDEPGAPVVFNVIVHNTSVESVHITALTDAVGGGAPVDVTTVAAPILASTCTDAIGHVLAIGAEYACQFTMFVGGDAGDTVGDTVVATLVDNDGGTTTPNDETTVDVDDVLPTMAVSKSTSAGDVDAPGGPVPFTVVIANTSPEPVTIDSITDSVAGGAPIDVTLVNLPVTVTDCVAGTVLAAAGNPGSTMTCHFTDHRERARCREHPGHRPGQRA